MISEPCYLCGRKTFVQKVRYKDFKNNIIFKANNGAINRLISDMMAAKRHWDIFYTCTDCRKKLKR